MLIPLACLAIGSVPPEVNRSSPTLFPTRGALRQKQYLYAACLPIIIPADATQSASDSECGCRKIDGLPCKHCRAVKPRHRAGYTSRDNFGPAPIGLARLTIQRLCILYHRATPPISKAPPRHRGDKFGLRLRQLNRQVVTWPLSGRAKIECTSIIRFCPGSVKGLGL